MYRIKFDNNKLQLLKKQVLSKLLIKKTKLKSFMKYQLTIEFNNFRNLVEFFTI